ncbi:MAG: hypothetical protein P8X69_02105 [Maritimibacter sp.]|jgi:hypothetical protein
MPMELRHYSGCFIIDGRESEEVDLRVILSTGGGVTTGSGSFQVPASLVGLIESGTLRYRTLAGEEFNLTLREIDMGEAYFLTGGLIPASTPYPDELIARNKGVA